MERALVVLRMCGFAYAIGHAAVSFSRLSQSDHTAYRTFGRLLRLPIFLVAIYLWSLIIFPFLVGAAVVAASLQVAFYPLISVTRFLLGAFAGESKPPSLENYWHDFPNRYFRWLRFGTVALEAWTITGLYAK
jgi:hypothetical protein